MATGLLRFAPRNDENQQGVITTIRGDVRADTFRFCRGGRRLRGLRGRGRLSEDPKTSVALLEAGGGGDNWVVSTPGALALMVPSKLNNWAFDTVPQAGLEGRIGYQPRGKGLGGSSAINAMVYIRATTATTTNGRRWQCRLVLCRRVALFQAFGRQRRFRRRLSRQGRAFARQQNCAPTTRCSKPFCKERTRRSFAFARILMAEITRVSASIR